MLTPGNVAFLAMLAVLVLACSEVSARLVSASFSDVEGQVRPLPSVATKTVLESGAEAPKTALLAPVRTSQAVPHSLRDVARWTTLRRGVLNRSETQTLLRGDGTILVCTCSWLHRS